MCELAVLQCARTRLARDSGRRLTAEVVPPMAREQHDSFAAHLRRFRTAARLTQAQLAERAGLSEKAISALERGERHHPHPHTVTALATALHLSDADHTALSASIPPRGTVELF